MLVLLGSAGGWATASIYEGGWFGYGAPDPLVGGYGADPLGGYGADPLGGYGAAPPAGYGAAPPAG